MNVCSLKPEFSWFQSEAGEGGAESSGRAETDCAQAPNSSSASHRHFPPPARRKSSVLLFLDERDADMAKGLCHVCYQT